MGVFFFFKKISHLLAQKTLIQQQKKTSEMGGQVSRQVQSPSKFWLGFCCSFQKCQRRNGDIEFEQGYKSGLIASQFEAFDPRIQSNS